MRGTLLPLCVSFPVTYRSELTIIIFHYAYQSKLDWFYWFYFPGGRVSKGVLPLNREEGGL